MNRIESIRIGLVSFQRLTLLILGKQRAFGALAKCLARRQGCQLGKPFIDGGITLAFEFDPDGQGTLQRKENQILWMMSDGEATKVAEQLAQLAATPIAKSGHAYLDPMQGQPEFEIVASVGEYQADRMFADGKGLGPTPEAIEAVGRYDNGDES